MPRDVIPTASHKSGLVSMNASDFAKEVLAGKYDLSNPRHDYMYKRGYTFPKYNKNSEANGSGTSTAQTTNRGTTTQSTDRGTNGDSNATVTNVSTIKADQKQ